MLLKKIINWFKGYDDQLHPAFTFCKEMAKIEPRLILKFEAYTRAQKGIPYQSDTPERRRIAAYLGTALPPNLIVATLLNKLSFFNNLEELGISPDTFINEEEFLKIPLIDFKTHEISENDFRILARRIAEDIPSLIGSKFMIFNSGNSYHGYVTGLMTDTEYRIFELLLRDVSFVDQGWIDAGMKCLRWTASSPTYMTGRIVPQLTYSMEI